MSHPSLFSRLLGLMALLLAFSSGYAASDDERLPKTVIDFRYSLRQFTGLSKADIDKRQERLLKEADKLTSMTDKLRALTLIDWETESLNVNLAAADTFVRRELMERFTKQAKDIVHSGTAAQRIALATLLTETAVNLRKQSPGTYLGNIPTAKDLETQSLLVRAERRKREYVRSNLGEMAIELAKLTGADHPAGVRKAGALALGQIEPALGSTEALTDSVNALTALLKPGNEPELRRVAATALMEMMHITADEQSKTYDLRVISLIPIRDVSLQILPRVSPPLLAQDSDMVVRRQCARAWLSAATSLANVIPSPESRSSDSRSSERSDPPSRWREELKPISDVIYKHRAALGRGVNDPDVNVRSDVRHTVENLGKIPQRLADYAKNYPEPVKEPKPKDDKKEEKKEEKKDANSSGPGPALRPVRYEKAQARAEDDPLIQSLVDLRSALIEGLKRSDASTPARLALVGAIEALGDLGAEAIRPLAERGLSDPNLFVRWVSARTLGKLAPREPAVVVPRLARMLTDQDLDLRLTVARSLRRYGSSAVAALPALEQMVSRGDVDSRVAMLNSISAIITEAPAEAASSLKTVAGALEDRDALVRSTAADVLGRYGPRTKKHVADVLTRLSPLLTDPDADVRTAASEAVLRISGK
jgi:HEAT repeat protein